MARVIYSKNVPKFDNFSQFDGATLKLKELDGNAFTLKDKDGTSMVFEGNNFDRTQGVVTGGTITSAEFYNNKDKVIYSFDGLSVDAQMLYKAFTLDKDPMRIIHGLMDGNDTVTGTVGDDSMWGFGGIDDLRGRAGNDFLYGHRGDDILTGGKGIDTFMFATGYDHDTVTDFDRAGPDHDFIRMDYYLFDDIVYSESDGTVTLTLPTGDELTLAGITQSQIEGKTKYFDFY
jgi:Ca2+-binding RTX toxin-like protein